MQSLLKIAHRGASSYKPENTLISFKKALDLKVDGIELDVHLSLDDEIMVIHDETINRTTNGKGPVKNYSASELQKYGIPTLSDVLALVNHDCFLNIELKASGIAKKIVELLTKSILEKNWNYNDFIVSSFDWKMLEEVVRFNPKIRIGVLTEANILDALAFAKKIKAFSIHPNFALLTKENVALMQENSFEVYAWTVNAKNDIKKIKAFNVNGIISDFPDKI